MWSDASSQLLQIVLLVFLPPDLKVLLRVKLKAFERINLALLLLYDVVTVNFAIFLDFYVVNFVPDGLHFVDLLAELLIQLLLVPRKGNSIEPPLSRLV